MMLLLETITRVSIYETGPPKWQVIKWHVISQSPSGGQKGSH